MGIVKEEIILPKKPEFAEISTDKTIDSVQLKRTRV
jgi:hypothetical protein